MEYRTPPSAEPPSLREAIRKARLDDAERAAAIADLRGGELARLEVLNDTLAPVFSQLPDGVELFDHGIVPGERPRLYVDILAFVEMVRGTRQYRFVQDSRWGQRVMAESEDVTAIRKAVTNYVALRLVEREKALVSDGIQGRLNTGEPEQPLASDAVEERLRAKFAQVQSTEPAAVPPSAVPAPVSPAPAVHAPTSAVSPPPAPIARPGRFRYGIGVVAWLLIGAVLGVAAYAYAVPWFVTGAL
ncbi:MAG: hypothetical protein ACREDP_06755 [Bradyrhizobium sp.]